MSKEDVLKKAGDSAFVIGYTGEVGKALAQELASRGVFEKVVLIGRRKVDLPTSGGWAKMEQHVVDFDKLDEHKSAFEGAGVGYCTLGTTRGKSGADGFVKVDHDYVLASARVAKECGTRQFHLVTSAGANANSPLLYSATKGRVEEAVKQLGFERLTIYRPAMLMVDRAESRPIERFAQLALTPISFLAPTLMTIPVPKLARAMVNQTVQQRDEQQQPPPGGVETLENAAIHRLAGDAEVSTK